MPKILITGKNSFIGRSIIKYSCFDEIRDVCLIENHPSIIDFTTTDVVIHVAAIVHQTKKIPKEMYQKVNTFLPIEVAKYAKKSGVNHFIFISTTKVYGDHSDNHSTPFNEEAKCNPSDMYALSKLEAEIGLKELETPEFTITIIRTPLVYGKGVKANMKNIINLVRIFPILPLKNIKNKRSFTYIENLVGYIDKIIEKKVSGVLIAMDKEWLSTDQLVKIIAECLEKKVFLFKCPIVCRNLWKLIAPRMFSRLHESFFFDNGLTNEFLDYKAPISTHEGIKRTIE